MNREGAGTPGKNAAGGDVALLTAAARTAAALVDDGMTIGMGTGRAATLTLRLLAQRVREQGLRVRGVPTSARTAQLARDLGLEITDLEASPRLDLALDGADEVDPNLNLVKGLGGALLREKIVALAAAPHFVVVVDESKLVPHLGVRAPLPVEVVTFGWQSTRRALIALGLRPELRQVDGLPFRTDNGNVVLDCFPAEGAPPGTLVALGPAIKALTGVVEHGLFAHMAEAIVVAGATGTARVLRRQDAAGHDD